MGSIRCAIFQLRSPCLLDATGGKRDFQNCLVKFGGDWSVACH